LTVAGKLASVCDLKQQHERTTKSAPPVHSYYRI
jgi:hypothetical protein